MLPHSAGLQGAPQFHPAKAICAQVAVLQSLSVGLLVWLSSMRPGLLFFFFFLQSRTLSCFLLYSFSISCNLFLAVNHAGKNMLCFFFYFYYYFLFFFNIQSPLKAVLMLTFLPREPELSAWGPAVRPGCERGDLTHFMAVALILD